MPLCIEKFGGKLALCSHVEKILIENGRAVGVKLRSGQVSSSEGYFFGKKK